MAAAIEELSARDYADISVESIAARAGVHKTTVYRRWGSKVEIIKQALVGAASQHIQVPDTGSVDSDLLLLARAVQVVLSQGAAISTALIVGGLASAELAGLMRQYWAVRMEAISVVVHRAVDRGELPAGTNPATLMRTMAAPLFYQLLVAREPVTEADARLSSAATLAAAKAGVFAELGSRLRRLRVLVTVGMMVRVWLCLRQPAGRLPAGRLPGRRRRGRGVAGPQGAGRVAALVGQHRPVVAGQLGIPFLEPLALLQGALPVPDRVAVTVVGLLPRPRRRIPSRRHHGPAEQRRHRRYPPAVRGAAGRAGGRRTIGVGNPGQPLEPVTAAARVLVDRHQVTSCRSSGGRSRPGLPA